MFPCLIVPGPIYLSGCITRLLLRCFHAAEELLLSQPYPIGPAYSIGPCAQSQAQPTATYSLPSLARTPSLYLCFSLTNCFVIYVAFLKPLSSGWAGHDGPLSVHKIIEFGSCTCKWPSANTQISTFRQNREYFAKYMCAKM